MRLRDICGKLTEAVADSLDMDARDEEHHSGDDDDSEQGSGQAARQLRGDDYYQQ